MNKTALDARTPHAAGRFAALSLLSRCSAVSACLVLTAAIGYTVSAAQEPAAAPRRRELKDVYRACSPESPWLVPAGVVRIRPRLFARAR